MKRTLFCVRTALLIFYILLAIGTLPVLAQNKTDQPKVSADEQKAATKIKEAKDIAAKFQAASEFLAKYPKSGLRPKVVQYMSEQVIGLTDANQKVTYGEQFFSTFGEASETDLISPYLIEAYLNTKKFDEAFQVGENYLSRNADDVITLSLLATFGAQQLQQGNNKYSAQSIQFGNTAIGLFEANKKPANMSEERWAAVKTGNLPSLYQSIGWMLMMGGKRDDARAKLTKAVEISPADPRNYFWLGSIEDEIYRETAKAHQAALPGKQRDELLAKANVQMDKVIDYYARAIAAAEGKQEYQAFIAQLRQDTETYYKYRHNNSLDGLQELINKYKPMSLKP